MQIVALLTFENKTTELGLLYSRISAIADAMGGRATVGNIPFLTPGMSIAERQTQNTPTLHAEMTSSFEVQFTPTYPLSIGNALGVRAVRTYNGGRKNDWTFTYLQDGWHVNSELLSDVEIQGCLTPEGHPTFE